MNRRRVLKGIAAGSALSMGIAGASANSSARRVDEADLDRVMVKDGNRVVEVIENPSWDDVQEVEATLDDDQRLASPDEECVAFCEHDCPCYPCMVGCHNCCNVEEQICDGC